MPESTRRQLKIDVPSELRVQLKREAVDLDVSVKQYVLRILDNRLPWDVMNKIDARAKLEGMDGRAFLIKLLREAGVLD